MSLNHVINGDIDEWHTPGGRVMIVAADAVTLSAMVHNGEISATWRLYGSPEQPDGLFVAAHPELAATTLATITFHGNCLLIPHGEEWLPLGIADLDELTP